MPDYSPYECGYPFGIALDLMERAVFRHFPICGEALVGSSVSLSNIWITWYGVCPWWLSLKQNRQMYPFFYRAVRVTDPAERDC